MEECLLDAYHTYNDFILNSSKEEIDAKNNNMGIIRSITEDATRYFNTLRKAEKDRIWMDENTPVSFGLKHFLQNFEELYISDINEGIGFDLDVDIDYSDLYNESMFLVTKSIHSYKFGVSTKDSPEVQVKRYICECGELESHTAGQVCSKCGTPTDIRACVRGWFDLGEFKVFNPQFLNQVYANLIGKVKGRSKEELQRDLLTYRHKPDAYKNNGCPDPMNLFQLQDPANLKKWIQAYVKPEKQAYFLANIDAAMSSKLPVISKDFRPFRVTYNLLREPKIESHALNQVYRLINDKIRQLRKISNQRSELEEKGISNIRGSRYEEFVYLKNIQEHMIKVHDTILDSMDEKEDDIRQKAGAKRKGFSCRLVLESERLIHSDECILPYSIFGEVTLGYYREYYDRFGVTPEAINRMLNNSPNEHDCELMANVLEAMENDNVNYGFVYRAPSIYKGSAVGLRIIGLTKDLVIKVNEITIDACMHGDKDGDATANFIMPPEYNAIIFLACHPSAIVWNPMTARYNGGYELPESLYFSNYEVLGESRDDTVIIEGNDKEILERYKLTEPNITSKGTTRAKTLEEYNITRRYGFLGL